MGFGLDFNFSVVWMSFDAVFHCGWKRFIWGNWVFLSSFQCQKAVLALFPRPLKCPSTRKATALALC